MKPSLSEIMRKNYARPLELREHLFFANGRLQLTALGAEWVRHILERIVTDGDFWRSGADEFILLCGYCSLPRSSRAWRLIDLHVRRHYGRGVCND